MHDEARFFNRLRRDFPNTRIIGPNCPGLISPDKCNIGITAGHIARGGGPVGIVSRSGTLTYQALYELTQQSIGQTTCVGMGRDPVPAPVSLTACKPSADRHEGGELIEIGGSQEQSCGTSQGDDEAVVAYIAGVTPPGRRMGHTEPSGSELPARWRPRATGCRPHHGSRERWPRLSPS
jgi:succinyl-CoA synthetase alpha subunit